MPLVAPETKAEKPTVRGHSLRQSGGQSVSKQASQPPATRARGALLLAVPSCTGEREDNCTWRLPEYHREDNGALKLSFHGADSKGQSDHSTLAQRKCQWRGREPLCQHRNLCGALLGSMAIFMYLCSDTANTGDAKKSSGI